MSKQSIVLTKPMVFSDEGTEEYPDYPSFLAYKCTCGFIIFPRHHYGCEKCGNIGEDYEEVKLSGVGKIHSFAKVHRSPNEKYEAPYIVASVLLQAGCIVRGILTTNDETKLSIGQSVNTVLQKVYSNEKNEEVYDLRFEIEKEKN